MRRLLPLAALSVVYLVPTCLLAARRPLWHDEIYTLRLARLPGLADLWSALAAGADLVPPLFYVLTRAGLSLLGESPLALRLPAVLGLWVAALCAFRFVTRRTPGPGGGLAFLFLLVTHAAAYAYEARPTGLVFGFAGLALVSWQSAADGRRRHLALPALAGSLAAATATHYYGVLLLVPLAAGEVVRSRPAGRLDRPLGVAILLGAAPLPALLPLVRAARPFTATFWARPQWASIPEFYQVALAPAAIALVALLVLAAAPPRRYEAVPALPAHETVAVVGFVVAPALAVVLARQAGGPFAPRYVLFAVIGLAILYARAARTLLHGRGIVAVLTIILAASFLRNDVSALKQAAAQTADLAAVARFLEDRADPSLPLVIAQPGEFLEVAHAAPGRLADRLVYLADPAASVRHLGHDTADRALLALSRWTAVQVEEYGPWVAAHPDFQVYVRDGQPWWLPLELPPARLETHARQDGYVLLRVHGAAGSWAGR
jgi:hypothetical protein